MYALCNCMCSVACRSCSPRTSAVDGTEFFPQAANPANSVPVGGHIIDPATGLQSDGVTVTTATLVDATPRHVHHAAEEL